MATALDMSGLKPLDASGLQPAAQGFDLGGLKPLDVAGLKPDRPLPEEDPNRPFYEVGAAGIARGIQTGLGKPIPGWGRAIGSEGLVEAGKRYESFTDYAVPLSTEDQQ